MVANDGVVLVIGSGMRKYREYLLASAAARHPLWLFDSAPPTWQSRHVRGGTVVNLTDRAALLAAATELAARVPVRGVLSWDEALIVDTAHVAAALGLPGAGIDAIEGCRNKGLSRRLLTAAGVAQPLSHEVHDERAAVAAGAATGYPVVVKPRGGGASIGVVLAHDEAELRAAFHAAERASLGGSPAYMGGALVEEYLTGPEISVDGVSVAGRYRALFVARKSIGMHPYFEELGHVVDPDDELRTDAAVLDTLTAAHTAIAFGYGVTHTELKLTPRGPVIVEINGRLGGDLIPWLAKLATGIEPGAVAVDAATGVEPDPVLLGGTGPGRCVGIRFAYPDADCVVRSVSLPRTGPDPAAVTGVLDAAAMVEPGEHLQLPPNAFISRHAYVICAGRDRGECTALLATAMTGVELTTRPAPVPVAAVTGG